MDTIIIFCQKSRFPLFILKLDSHFDNSHQVPTALPVGECVVCVLPEELRRSMPNLAPRTSLRSLEAVRNSRSMEANLQSSGNRMSHLTHSPSTGNPTL